MTIEENVRNIKINVHVFLLDHRFHLGYSSNTVMQFKG